ncbi:MAG: FliM/FliN family flagellar motor switch protein [Candidatus Latescibacterota bacterium]
MAEEQGEHHDEEAGAGASRPGAAHPDEATPDYRLGQLRDPEEEDEDDTGVEEALQAWRQGGHPEADLVGADEVQPVRFAQLEPGVANYKARRSRLNNVLVQIAVELGRKEMTVRELAQLKEQDVIELDKLAGESFEIRVNGRLFALGEVVVVTDVMAVRITSLAQAGTPPELDE